MIKHLHCRSITEWKEKVTLFFKTFVFINHVFLFVYISGKTQNSSPRDVTKGKTTSGGSGEGPNQNDRNSDFTGRMCQL